MIFLCLPSQVYLFGPSLGLWARGAIVSFIVSWEGEGVYTNCNAAAGKAAAAMPLSSACWPATHHRQAARLSGRRTKFNCTYTGQLCGSLVEDEEHRTNREGNSGKNRRRGHSVQYRCVRERRCAAAGREQRARHPQQDNTTREGSAGRKRRRGQWEQYRYRRKQSSKAADREQSAGHAEQHRVNSPAGRVVGRAQRAKQPEQASNVRPAGKTAGRERRTGHWLQFRVNRE